jgi:hypothetical protein
MNPPRQSRDVIPCDCVHYYLDLQEMANDSAHVSRLEERLRRGLQERLQGVQLNGPEDTNHRWGGTNHIQGRPLLCEMLGLDLTVAGLRC